MLNSLNPVKRVREFIADMLKERTGRKHSVNEAREMAADHFEKLGLDKNVLDVYPHELSGGMTQRAITAISTLANPKLLITDEPTSALDVTSQKRMIELMIEIQRKGIIKSLMCISHDLSALNQLCDRIIIMYGGKFVESGKMDEVINNPLHPYTRALMDSLLPLERQTKNKSLTSIPGVVPDLRNPPPGCRFHNRCEKCTEICRSTEPPTIEKKGRSVNCWLYSRGRSK
ncbi:Oligopeptide transport ATP-binding protein OppD [subsurface metagenome]